MTGRGPSVGLFAHRDANRILRAVASLLSFFFLARRRRARTTKEKKNINQK